MSVPGPQDSSLDEMNSREMQVDFIKMLPKVELHAHLNGCIRETTLFELAQERGVTLNDHHFSAHPIVGEDHSMYNVRPRSLQDCFEMFAEIPKCVDDLDSLSRITMEALEDFAEHNVAYLELRSTPKSLLVKSGGTAQANKTLYCKTILECMRIFEKEEATRFESELANDGSTLHRLPMVCRFIVAIDRSQSVDDAYQHVDLAASLRNDFGDFVVGVDLGGNPTRGHFEDFRGAFEKARHYGLSVTLHCGEVPCDDNNPSTQDAFREAKAILDFVPDRVGHALLLPISLQTTLLKKKIPVESCPTSNVMTLELAKRCSGSLLEGLRMHPQLSSWIEQSHPFSIGTDDPGVFHTNVTKELLLLQKAFDLEANRIYEIVLKSIDHSFCDVETRKLVKGRLEHRIKELLKD